MENENKGTHLIVASFFMRLGGVPVNMKRVSIYYSVYNAFLTFSTYSTFLALFMDLIVNFDQLKRTIETLRVLLGVGVVLWIHLNLRFRKSKIERLMELTNYFSWEGLPTRDTEGYITMAGLIPRMEIMMKYAFIVCCVLHFFQVILRMVTTHEMVYNTWYPFDAFRSPVYEIVNVSQAVITLQVAGMFMGLQYLYALMVAIACSQLEKLKLNLKNIKRNHLHSVQVKSSTEELENASYGIFCQMQKQLNDCVRHHQQTLEFMRALEEVMNFTLCGLFLFIVSTMCFTAFSAITSWGDHTDLMQAIEIYLLLLVCAYVFCKLGTELNEHAQNVANAAYECDWVGTTVTFQRCLVFVINAASKDFTLTAGKFIPVTNSTMMNMLNQSLSFFMFLLTMKDKNEEIKS